MRSARLTSNDQHLMHLQFVESESTFDYFRATRAYLERHGKPVAFYSDKHGVFRVNRKDAAGGDDMTQFGRALHALNIDIICANTSQAKGRVERANATLQDRLVKEMRLCGINTLEAGNAFLRTFMTDYNARFAKPPFHDKNLHRPCAGHDDLDDAFAWKEERTVSVNLTLRYDQVMFILEPNEITRSLARKRVTVIDYPDEGALSYADQFSIRDKLSASSPPLGFCGRCRRSVVWYLDGVVGRARTFGGEAARAAVGDAVAFFNSCRFCCLWLACGDWGAPSRCGLWEQ